MDTPGILLSLGGIKLTAFGLFIALGLLAGFLLAKAQASRRNIRDAALENLYLGALLGGLIGARLIYVLVNINYYAESTGSILTVLKLWEGGYSAFGAVIGAVAGIRVTIGQRGFKRALDFMIPALFVTLAVWRLGELTTWQGRGMILDGASVFPFSISNSQGYACLAVCIYEAVAALALALYALKSKRKRAPGDIGFMCLMLLGLIQVPLESMRSDEFLALGFVKVDQLLAMALAESMIVIFLIGYLRADGNRIKGLSALAITLGMIGMCVAEEFKIDGSPNPALNYIMLMVYAFIMAICGQFLRVGWRKSRATTGATRTAPQWSTSAGRSAVAPEYRGARASTTRYGDYRSQLSRGYAQREAGRDYAPGERAYAAPNREASQAARPSAKAAYPRDYANSYPSRSDPRAERRTQR